MKNSVSSLLLLAICILHSCAPNEPYRNAQTVYQYNNNSSYSVEITRFSKFKDAHNQPKTDIIVINKSLETSNLDSSKGYLYYELDSLKLNFGNNKSLMFRISDQTSNKTLWNLSPLNGSVYKADNNDKIHIRLLYSIDDKIHELAQ